MAYIRCSSETHKAMKVAAAQAGISMQELLDRSWSAYEVSRQNIGRPRPAPVDPDLEGQSGFGFATSSLVTRLPQLDGEDRAQLHALLSRLDALLQAIGPEGNE